MGKFSLLNKRKTFYSENTLCILTGKLSFQSASPISSKEYGFEILFYPKYVLKVLKAYFWFRPFMAFIRKYKVLKCAH
jgi:hypothetical protein